MPEAPNTPTNHGPPDHYQVLHVQPDAPTEVIKASWRTLLGQLRLHPDLGGSHARAVSINAAWAVLGDASRRAAFDAARSGRAAPAPAPASTQDLAVASSSFTPLRPLQVRPPPVRQVPVGGQAVRLDCALCGQPVAAPVLPSSRCSACQSPLSVLQGAGLPGAEMLGRRGAVRRDQSHVAMLHIGWPSPALPVRWRDLSLTGLSFYAPQPIAPGRRVRLVDGALEGVAEVVGCRAQGRVYTVHARLLTALLLQSTGVFVSARA